MKPHGLIQRSFAPPDHALAHRVSHSAAISLAGVALRALVTIGSTAVLARLLTPADYGLLTMASLVTEFAALFSSFGIGAILIQMRRSSRLAYDTAFWFALGLGVVLMAAVWVFSFFASFFFDDPQVGSIVRVLAVLFLLEELTVVHSAVLQRMLKFKLEVAMQMGQLLLRVGITILFAWLGWGVWALVLGSLTARVAVTVVMWVMVPYWPRLRFDPRFVSARMRTGLSYLGNGLLSYLNNNIDYIVVGRRFGATELGYYQAAYSLSDEIRNRLAGPLQRVLFPAYSLVQDDLARFRAGILTSLRLLSVLVFPLGAGMAATAPEIVAILYGERWLSVVPLLQILAINGALRAIFFTTGAIYAAKNRMGTALVLGMIFTPLNLLVVYLAAAHGPAGVAWAMLSLSSTALISAHIGLRMVGMGLRDLFAAMAAPALSAALMAGGLVLARQWIGDLGLVPRLAIMVGMGACIYGIVLATLSPPTTELVIRTTRRLVQP